MIEINSAYQKTLPLPTAFNCKSRKLLDWNGSDHFEHSSLWNINLVKRKEWERKEHHQKVDYTPAHIFLILT